ARLKLMASVVTRDVVKLNLHLTDPEGKAVLISPNSMSFSADMPEASIDISVPSPRKWDAEHPNLYALRAELIVRKSAAEKVEREFGFRKVERRGNKLYVNGDPIKLRGVCRHDTDPLGGRVS